ncbi:MAG: radical SAM protein [Candidatus Riflebacteria bacterium]|nr:radical SAM protein [Candidatus Riflebacteria bacterium]
MKRPDIVIAWETTRACTLSCRHCRASSSADRSNNELTVPEISKVFSDASKLGKCIIIFSGGEPLIRKDLEEAISAAVKAGHFPAVSTADGSLLTEERLDSLIKSGVSKFSFSIHSHDENLHDNFSCREGATREAVDAFRRIRQRGIDFQVNTTVLPHNWDKLNLMLEKVIEWGADSWHVFFTVPTGRACGNDSLKISSQQTEKVLKWLAEIAIKDVKIPIKVTCAPQYSRVLMQSDAGNKVRGRSCMAGNGFIFISSTGEVKPCGYFDIVAGNVRELPFDEIYTSSEILKSLRKVELLEGNCGVCGYKTVCGGCRAKAFAGGGNIFASDPDCQYLSGK